jgi:hypothetical protein
MFEKHKYSLSEQSKIITNIILAKTLEEFLNLGKIIKLSNA